MTGTIGDAAGNTDSMHKRWQFTIVGFAYDADGRVIRGLAANDPQATYWLAAILSLDWAGDNDWIRKNAPYDIGEVEIDWPNQHPFRGQSFAMAQAAVNTLLAKYPGSIQVIWTPRSSSR